MRFRIVVMTGVLMLGLGACDGSVEPERASPGVPVDLNDDSPDPTTGCIVPTDRFADGGVGKDGIPALTNPPLVDAAQATYLADPGLPAMQSTFSDSATGTLSQRASSTANLSLASRTSTT